MSYLNRANGYAPTGRTNSEPRPTGGTDPAPGAKIRTVHSAQWGSLSGELVDIDAHDVRIRWDLSVPGSANAHVTADQRGVTPSGLLYTRAEYDRNVAAGRFIVGEE